MEFVLEYDSPLELSRGFSFFLFIDIEYVSSDSIVCALLIYFALHNTLTNLHCNAIDDDIDVRIAYTPCCRALLRR